MSLKVKVSCYLEKDMLDWLSLQAEGRGESLSSHIGGLLVDARRQVEEPASTMAEQMTVHLDRLHRSLQDIGRETKEDHRFMEEMFAMFVRVYLNHAPEVPEHRTREVSKAGGERFEKFLKYLIDHYGKKSLLNDVRLAKTDGLPSLPEQENRP